jgi:hypothetical protein
LIFSEFVAAPFPRDSEAGFFGPFPLARYSRLAFQYLVGREEVLNLGQPRVREVAEIVDFGESGIDFGDSEDLLVVAPFVLHDQDPDRADAHAAAWERGLLNKDQHVERVAVTAFCPDDESVVAGIVHRRKEDRVEANGR